jgi:hypothetical protein
LGPALPKQEVVRSNGNLTPTDTSPFLDVTLSVFAKVTQVATGLDETLFDGTAVFKTDGSVDFSGDFGPAKYNTGSHTDIVAGLMRTTLTGLPTIPFTVKGSTDFDLTIDTTLTIGDPNGPDFTLASPLTETAGASALFTIGAELPGGNFTLTTAPEPSTVVLAALAGVGMAVYSWRRRTSLV